MDMKNFYLPLSEISEQSIISFHEKKKTDVINSISVMFKCHETERKSVILHLRKKKSLNKVLPM